MLMSLLVLVVAGGALAFKVKFNENYCWALIIHDGEMPTCSNSGANARICQNLIEGVTITTAAAIFFSFTASPLVVVPGQDPCPSTLRCYTIPRKLTADR